LKLGIKPGFADKALQLSELDDVLKTGKYLEI
jgi:hypothetical protein